MPQKKHRNTLSFPDARPDLMPQWDYEANTVDPHELRHSSKEKAWWRCLICGQKWQQAVLTRRIRADTSHVGCYAASGPSVTEAASEAVLAQWDYELNEGMDPAIVSSRISKVVWWKCSVCDTRWQQRIVGRCYGGDSGYHSGCSAVRQPVAEIPEERLLATVRPDLAAQWDHERNGSLDLVSHGSGAKAWWVCQHCGLKWEQKIRLRGYTKTDHHRGCVRPVTNVAAARVGEKRRLIIERPDLAVQWNSDENDGIVSSLSLYGTTPDNWACPFCGSKWAAQVTTRVNAKTSHHTGCTISIAQQRAVDSLTRAFVSGEIAIEEVEARILELLGEDQPCATYLNRLTDVSDALQSSSAPFRESLADARPLLAAQMHPRKNGDLKASDLTSHSVRPVWWLCPACGDEWFKAPNHRTAHGHRRSNERAVCTGVAE